MKLRIPSNLKSDKAEFIKKKKILSWGFTGQRAKTIPKITFLKLPAVFMKNFLRKFSVKLTQLNLFLKNLLQRFSVKRTKRYPESCFSYLSEVFLWNRLQKFYDILKLRFNQTYNYLKIIFAKKFTLRFLGHERVKLDAIWSFKFYEKSMRIFPIFLQEVNVTHTLKIGLNHSFDF